MRLFTAVCFDEKTKDFLEQCQIKIRECIRGGNFTSRDNLHLTLIFLGEVSPNKILDLKQSVDKVKFDKFELTFNVIGSFRRRESSIVWVGFKPNRMLSAVYENLAAELKYSVSGISVNYITVTPMEGSVVAGGNQVLQVKLDRETMPENANTTFKISDGTNEESITVKATKPVAKMEVSPLSLDFGEEATEKVFTISNTGTAEFTWNITVPTGTGLTVSETSGVTKPAETKQITVTLDRSIMPETLNTTIEVSDGVNKEKISVNAIKGSAIAGTVVTQGLYTYYKFDGNFEDATENGINGFGSPAPSFVEGVIPEGKAIKFSKTYKIQQNRQ